LRSADLPRLTVITDWTLPRDQVWRALAALAPLGPRLAIQFRAPGMFIRRFLEDARALRALLQPHGTPLFINGRLDVALLLGAHLHLPAQGLRVLEARRHLGPGRWISAAVHDEPEALGAWGADLALVSPVFSPGSKPLDTRATLGAVGLRRLAARLECPVHALGGIEVDSLQALDGVHGVAVVSAVLRASDPRSAAEALLARLPSGATASRH
jgi:thiamine-phosphate pyrophosphorylase